MAHYFTPIRNILNLFISLDVDQLAFEIAQQKPLQDLVIELNTRKQLFDKGEDSRGAKLVGKNIAIDGVYAPRTIKIKQAKGQPTNRVTLFDTGEFYASFVIKPFKGGFTIDADDEKPDFDLFDEFGEDVVGLNPENLQTIINYFRNAVLEKINTRLKAA